ncbi:MAG TPA: ATP-binding protein [Kamptonema sp.]|nr:ATP-binding protein [Kamptonema sp.]
MKPENPNKSFQNHLPTLTKHHQPLHPDLGWQRNFLEKIAQKFNNMSIRSKIRCGYALALGVGFGGTLIGMLVGNYYYQKAAEQVDIEDRENRRLRNLQAALLRTQISQHHIVFFLQQSEVFDRKYKQLQTHTETLKQRLYELQSELALPQVKAFKPFMKNYEQILEAYIQNLEEIIEQVAVLKKSKDGVAAAEKLLSNFANDRIGFQLDNLANELAEAIEVGDNQEDEAQDSSAKAEVLRSQMIFSSMVLSVLVVVFLANYTSRALSDPLTAVTEIAKRTTKESNFDLQVPVTSEDEVGVLATSLNQLILKIKYLLAELEAEKESQLIQSEKMASLGRMLAGVAHEVNNPINFIYGNLPPAQDYVDDLLSLLATYEAEIPNPSQLLVEKTEEIDIEFLKEDLPKILRSMKVGAERAIAIILSLKDFSRLDQETPHPVDLHACIESTLVILNNRVKKGVKVIRNYGTIPNIEGYMGLLYQVFMNIISNALDALEEAQEHNKYNLVNSIAKIQDGEEKNTKMSFSPTITITTEYLDLDSVVVRIADNGTGIAAKTQDKMFQTFFTTKPRGVGTGLGLAISRNIVVEKHGGTINFWSEVGTGTEFVIALPIKH